jgi:dGTPase
VVAPGESDFPRTRLTHSLEVAQIGRELAGAFGADPDLVEGACLAHDLGHPPFGHTGEAALDAVSAAIGGFEGNAQNLRIMSRLEAKIITADGRSAGINATRALLDATTKYPWRRREGERKFGVYRDDLPVFRWVRAATPPESATAKCFEAQIMDWSDDVAYSVHDLEDGIHAGFVDLERLDDADEAAELVEVAQRLYGGGSLEALDGLRASSWWVRGGAADTPRALIAVKAMTSELTARFSTAALLATREAYGDGPLRRYDADLVVPAVTRDECALLKAVTARWVMARSGVEARQAREREMLTELVGAVADRAGNGDPGVLETVLLPDWQQAADDAARMRVVVDQVARLTDLSAVRWHERLVSPSAAAGDGPQPDRR